MKHGSLKQNRRHHRKNREWKGLYFTSMATIVKQESKQIVASHGFKVKI